MSNRTPFAAFTDKPAAVDMLRAAAAIYIPNRAFRDRNPSLYTGTVLGPDTLTWNRSIFRGWYYYGSAPGDPYGSYTGAKRPPGAYDAESLYLATTGTTTGESISTNHRVLAATIFSEFLPFSAKFQAHYDKPVSLALVARIDTDCTIGTDLKAYLACYGSDGLYDGAVEIVFDTLVVGASPSYQRLLGRTLAGLPSTTAFVQLHIGIKSPDGVNTGFEFCEASLMLNPENQDRAIDASPVLFVDLEDLHIQNGASFQFEALGISDATMLDGRRIRTAVLRDNLRYAFAANFGRKMSAERMRRILTIWNLGTRGLGFHVPNPVPVCLDFGFGTGPFFAPFWPEGSTFVGAHDPAWTLAGEGFLVGMTFREA